MKIKRILSLILTFICIFFSAFPSLISSVAASTYHTVHKFTSFETIFKSDFGYIDFLTPSYSNYAIKYDLADGTSSWELSSDPGRFTGSGNFPYVYQNYLEHPRSYNIIGDSFYYIDDICKSDPITLRLIFPFYVATSVKYKIEASVRYYDSDGNYLSGSTVTSSFSSYSTGNQETSLDLKVPSGAVYMGVALMGYPVKDQWKSSSFFEFEASSFKLRAFYSGDLPSFGDVEPDTPSIVEILKVASGIGSCTLNRDTDFPGDPNTLIYTDSWVHSSNSFLHSPDASYHNIIENPYIMSSNLIRSTITTLKDKLFANGLGGVPQVFDISALRELDPLRIYLKFTIAYEVDVPGQMWFYPQIYSMTDEGFKDRYLSSSSYTPMVSAGSVNRYSFTLDVPNGINLFYYEVEFGRNSLNYSPNITIYDFDLTFCCEFASSPSDFPEVTNPSDDSSPSIDIDLSGVENQLGDVNSNLDEISGSISGGFAHVHEDIADLGDDITSGLDDVETAIGNMDTNINQGLDDLGDQIGDDLENLQESIDAGLSDVESAIDVTNDKIKESNNLLGNVVEGITSLPQKILDGIIGLFVPSEEDLQEYNDKWDELLRSRFGALYESVDLIDEYAGTMEEKAATNTVSFPSVTLNLAGVPFTFGGWDVRVVPEGFDEVFDMLKWMISIIATLGMVNALRNKFERLLGGV